MSVRPLGTAPPFLPIRFRPLSLTRDIVVCTCVYASAAEAAEALPGQGRRVIER